MQKATKATTLSIESLEVFFLLLLLDDRFRVAIQKIRVRAGIPPYGFEKSEEYIQWKVATAGPDLPMTLPRPYIYFQKEVRKYFQNIIPAEGLFAFEDFIASPILWVKKLHLVGIDYFSNNRQFVPIIISPYARQEDVVQYFENKNSWAEIKAQQRNRLRLTIPRFKATDIRFYIRLKELKDQNYTYKEISLALKTEGLSSFPPTVIQERWKWISRLMRVHLPPRK